MCYSAVWVSCGMSVVVVKKSKILGPNSTVAAELKLESQHTQSIVLGTAYATMKAISGEKNMTNKWMQQIEACVRSGCKSCDPIKGIAVVRTKNVNGSPTVS